MRSFVPITPLGSEFLKPIFVGEVITCHPADDDATQSRLGTWPPAQFSTRGRPQLPRGMGESPRPIAPSHGENRGSSPLGSANKIRHF